MKRVGKFGIPAEARGELELTAEDPEWLAADLTGPIENHE